jgi:putative transposase
MTERDFGVTPYLWATGDITVLYRYRRRRSGCAGPRDERIQQIAEAKRRYGYRRIYIRLLREGWAVNRKHVYRLYREAGLAMRTSKRKRIRRLARPEQSPQLVAIQPVLADFDAIQQQHRNVQSVVTRQLRV